MKNLMYNLACSDIRVLELKLNRIKLTKERLYSKKPFIFNYKKYKSWQEELKSLEEEEENTELELYEAYSGLEEEIKFKSTKI